MITRNTARVGTLILAVALILPWRVVSAEETITVDALPSDTDAFVALRDELASTPEGGAAVFLTALLVFVENPELGEQFLTIALDRDNLQSSQNGYRGFRPGRSIQYHLNRLGNMKHLPGSYVLGTTPAAGYEASAPYRFQLTRNRYSVQAEDRIKVFVACSGASSPRPITLQRNNRGVWKVKEASSVFVGVAAPGPGLDDDL